MNRDQAQRIKSYNGVPAQRFDQILLIQTAGYTRLRGKSLTQCPDSQVYATAKKLYEAAIRIVNSVRYDPIIQADVSPNYANALRAMFNVADIDCDIGELESQLLD